jgi:hypothetical protein
MILIRFLDTNGNGTGTKEVLGNYAVTATNFYIQPPAGSIYILTQFYIQLSDAGAFGQSVYGSLATALTNGLLIRAYRGTVVALDLTDGIPVKYNDQFYHLSSDTQVISWSGGLNTLTSSFDYRTFNTPLVLDGNYNDKLQVTLNDDFTLLVDQTFMVRGYTL